jgi:hypothetical protein
MATFPDHTGFSFSFSHGRIVLGDQQFLAIGSIQASQEIEEGIVRGASVDVLARTLGQLTMGEGTVTFSDLGQAMEFFSARGKRPLAQIWNADYSLVNERNEVQSIEMISCRLLKFGFDHGEGAEALKMEFPFSFMTMKINGEKLI